MALKLLVYVLLLTHNILCDKDFSYEGRHGPSHWADDYNDCVGKHQSPINIEEHFVTNVTLPFLKFVGFDRLHDTYIKNNGHTVVLSVNDSESMMISGGPLGHSQYKFEQLHFHWGENDLEGSEDLINNHSFAMELHVVFYKSNYGSFSQAVHHPDGLTVLAYFIEASDGDNLVYEPIVDILPKIETVGSSMKLPHLLNLEVLLIPEHLFIQNYFTYNGSLTTPPCSEAVIWIDFHGPMRLSHEQIAAFRSIRGSEGVPLTHNFRPVQPLEDRKIFHNIPVFDNDMDNMGHSSYLAPISLTFASLFLTIPPEIWSGLFNIFT